MGQDVSQRVPVRIAALACRFADLLNGDHFRFINEEHGRDYATLSEPCIKTGSDSYASEGAQPGRLNRQIRQRKVYRLDSPNPNRKETATESEG